MLNVDLLKVLLNRLDMDLCKVILDSLPPSPLAVAALLYHLLNDDNELSHSTLAMTPAAAAQTM
jgi:hypothetical protein